MVPILRVMTNVLAKDILRVARDDQAEVQGAMHCMDSRPGFRKSKEVALRLDFDETNVRLLWSSSPDF